jgi:multidrug efflux pump subunit AcrA (membrane-fusion protein)
MAAAGWALAAAAAAAAADGDGGTVRARGLLRAEADIHLVARGGGLVASIERLEGEAVRPGEAVVVLDDSSERALLAQARCDLEGAELDLKKLRDGARPEDLERAVALHEEARAGLDLAEKTLKSDLELHAGGFLSELSRQRSERSLEAARAQVEARRLDLVILRKGARPEELRRSEIEVERRRSLVEVREREAAQRRVSGTRPGRAFVARVWVEQGQWVDGGRPVADLVYMDRIRVEVDLPAAEGLRARRGAKAVVRSPLFPGVELAGTVSRLAPTIDPASGTVRAVVEADNPDLRVRPGVEAEVEIAL